MKTSKQPYRILLAVAVVAATVSTGANAEYRCQALSTPEDNVACELAKLDRPDELRLFIERTRSIYGLYFYDYVSQNDVDRWYAARDPEKAPSIRAADDHAEVDRNN